MEFLRRVYNRILRIPIIGFIVGKIVRGTKRFLGIPPARSVDRFEMLQSALVGLKNENERLIRRIEEIEKEQLRLRQYNTQLACVVELLEARHIEDLEGGFEKTKRSSKKTNARRKASARARSIAGVK